MGKYKFGKPNREIELPEFMEYLNSRKFLKAVHRAYFVLLYWIGSRRTELLDIKKEDITEEGGSLFVNIPAFKGGERAGKLELPLEIPGIMFVYAQWQRTRKGKKLFRFKTSTTWRIIKRLNKKLSPHWFRHNRITRFRQLRDQGKLSTDDIKAWTGIKRDSTIEHYGMKTEKGIHKVSKTLQEK